MDNHNNSTSTPPTRSCCSSGSSVRWLSADRDERPRHSLVGGATKTTTTVAAAHRCRTTARLYGRVMDSGSDFFRDRRHDPQDEEDGNFMMLRGGRTAQETDEEYGPGPALIFYNVPQGIQDEELVDMLRDGAPKAIKKGVSLLRMDTSTTSEWMDMSLEDALKKVVLHSKDPSFLNEPDPLTTDAGLLATTPVLFFSGFTNREMMSTFQIISHEVHKETQGRLSVACAMAMPNSMSKRLRQVLLDVSGDHLEVRKPRSSKKF